MRQIQVMVAGGDEGTVLRLAEEHGAFSPGAATVRTVDGGERSMVFASLPNDCVGEFVAAVEAAVEDAQIALVPRGVLPLHTPVGEVNEKVRSVTPRSSLELVLGGLQSIGSWRGMLLYAVFSGLVAGYATPSRAKPCAESGRCGSSRPTPSSPAVTSPSPGVPRHCSSPSTPSEARPCSPTRRHPALLARGRPPLIPAARLSSRPSAARGTGTPPPTPARGRERARCRRACAARPASPSAWGGCRRWGCRWYAAPRRRWRRWT